MVRDTCQSALVVAAGPGGARIPFDPGESPGNPVSLADAEIDCSCRLLGDRGPLDEMRL